MINLKKKKTLYAKQLLMQKKKNHNYNIMALFKSGVFSLSSDLFP